MKKNSLCYSGSKKVLSQMITSVVCISHVHVLSITPTFLIVQPSLDSNKYPICTNVQVLINYDGN